MKVHFIHLLCSSATMSALGILIQHSTMHCSFRKLHFFRILAHCANSTKNNQIGLCNWTSVLRQKVNAFPCLLLLSLDWLIYLLFHFPREVGIRKIGKMLWNRQKVQHTVCLECYKHFCKIFCPHSLHQKFLWNFFHQQNFPFCAGCRISCHYILDW